MILMKLGDIKGISEIDAHKEWVEVDAVQFGVGRSISSASTSGDRDTSNPSFSEVTISKPMDIASADIYAQACSGKAKPGSKCELHWVQTSGTDEGGQVYFKLDLIEPLVSSYSMSSGGERPSESFSINFVKIEYQYDSFSGSTKTTGTPKKFNLGTNKFY